MFTAVAIHPEVNAVSPVIVAAYRRRIIDLDDTRADTAMLQCIDRTVMMSDDAGLLDKPGVAADHPLIPVNHIAPIEHIVWIGNADILDRVEPIKAAAPHIGLARVVRGLRRRIDHLDPARRENAAV